MRGLYPGSVTWGKAFPTLDGWAAVHVPEGLSLLDWSPSQGLITRVRARIRGSERLPCPVSSCGVLTAGRGGQSCFPCHA